MLLAHGYDERARGQQLLVSVAKLTARGQTPEAPASPGCGGRRGRSHGSRQPPPPPAPEEPTPGAEQRQLLGVRLATGSRQPLLPRTPPPAPQQQQLRHAEQQQQRGDKLKREPGRQEVHGRRPQEAHLQNEQRLAVPRGRGRGPQQHQADAATVQHTD